MKENCTNWELSHVPTVVPKVGVRGTLVSIPGSLQQQLLKKNCRKKILKGSLPQKKTIYFPPKDYQFIQKFTSTAEDLLNVIIKIDRI